MKIKMSNIVNLQDVYDKIKTQSLPITTTYKISKLFNAIKNEQEFYSTQLDAIIQQYGKKDENGNFIRTENGDGIQVDNANIKEVESKLNELWKIEVELPDITFTLNELEKINLSVEEFNNFLPFIED